MIAKKQYKLTAADLDILLSVMRAGTLSAAGERLGVDSSTVFRSIQRIERGLGHLLFERSRSGYIPLELAKSLIETAEQIETALESARTIAQTLPEKVSGTVRVSTTDTILNALIAPTLLQLNSAHPFLAYEFHTGNELVSLNRRDTDIAVRVTGHPPQQLIGKYVGAIRMALFASGSGAVQQYSDVIAGKCPWIAPDNALPDHPSVTWRKRQFPKVVPTYSVNSIVTVLEFVATGLGVGVLPLFLVSGRSDLIQLTDVIDACQTDLWLLAHPESKHSRRVMTVFSHLSQNLRLE